MPDTRLLFQSNMDENSIMHFIPSDRFIKITTIDSHTQGDPFRIITSGVPQPLMGQGFILR